jgi:hypothetical protein
VLCRFKGCQEGVRNLAAEVHTVVLYGMCAVALAVTAATRRREGDPAPPAGPIVKALWPFALLGLLESLSLCASCKLVAEWLLPGLCSLAVVAFCRSTSIARWARRSLVLGAVLLWLHGHSLLHTGYVTRTSPILPGRKLESAWYTPLTGLRREFSLERVRVRQPSAIPDPSEIVSVSVTLYNEDGDQVSASCVVNDARKVRAIVERLTPHERSEDAGTMLSLPIACKLGFHCASGTTWVEFVDAGMNPICFRVGDKAYLRGGARYQRYRSDHQRLYGIDSENVDEARAFYRQLTEMCEK